MSEKSAYQKRFGGSVEDSKYPTNDFIEQVLSRNTIRGFKNQPLAEGQLELLVAAAQNASTSGMLQTWSVIALIDKESRERLVERMAVAEDKKKVAQSQNPMGFDFK